MNIAEFQSWLNEHGANIAVDGAAGPVTRAAILQVFTNTEAPAVNDADILAFASNIGCTAAQLRAVATVESGGGAFDGRGRPKILWERQYFHRLTQGKWSVTPYSNPVAGGYNEDSWEKLTYAASKDPSAAFQSASWGRFQIMGSHWRLLGYSSPLEMAYSMVGSEAAHYDALVRFVKANGLADEMAGLSNDPNDPDNIAFARQYNGPGYAKYRYNAKLAEAMK